MKKTIAPSRKLGRMIAKNLIILLTLAVVSFVGMWAWFTQSTRADANGIQVKCEAPDGVEIAIVEPGATPKSGDYKQGTITLAEQEFLEQLALSEVTSDGIKFYKPALTQSNGIATPNTDAEWETAEVNYSYLSFDLYIRSTSTQTVSLTTNSKFTTASSVLTGATAGNKSAYGNFSKDCVVGASRFSVLDGSTRKLLWIPRPDLMLTSDAQGQLSVLTGRTSGDSYNHVYYNVPNGPEAGKTKTKTTMSASNVTTSSKLNNEYTLAKKTEIAKLSAKGTDGYYTNHVTCNMWIEGEDSEARLALVEGKFLIDLELTIK